MVIPPTPAVRTRRKYRRVPAWHKKPLVGIVAARTHAGCIPAGTANTGDDENMIAIVCTLAASFQTQTANTADGGAVATPATAKTSCTALAAMPTSTTLAPGNSADGQNPPTSPPGDAPSNPGRPPLAGIIYKIL
jgi:hypothetical protein